MDGPAGILLVGGFWFTTSSVFSTWANTAFLIEFQSGIGHTFVRFAGASILCALTMGPVTAMEKLRKGAAAFLVPAVALFCANFFNSIALEFAGITLTYTIKSTIPVCTVGYCVLVDGKRYSLQTYLSLVPLVVGASLAAASDVSFNLVGLLAALASTASQTILNIHSKRASARSEVTGFAAFFVMCVLCWAITTPLFFLLPSEPILSKVLAAFDNPTSWWPPAPWLLVVATALAYQMEYALNFIFGTYVGAVTFAVADIARRLAIITVGSFIFHKPLTLTNIGGIILALLGVGAYTFVTSRPGSVLNPGSPRTRFVKGV